MKNHETEARIHLKRRKSNKGYTLIEVLMAMSLLSFGLLAVGGMQIAAIRGNISARKISEANNLATATMETLINRTFEDGDLSLGSHDHPDNPIGDRFGIYWDVTSFPDDINLKKVAVWVEYEDRGGQRKVRLNFTKSNEELGLSI